MRLGKVLMVKYQLRAPCFSASRCHVTASAKAMRTGRARTRNSPSLNNRLHPLHSR